MGTILDLMIDKSEWSAVVTDVFCSGWTAEHKELNPLYGSEIIIPVISVESPGNCVGCPVPVKVTVQYGKYSRSIALY